MSCILFSLPSYEMLIEKSELSRSILRRFESRQELADDFFMSWAEWLFNLNADAYRERYKDTQDREIEQARHDDVDYEFSEVEDWNDPKTVGDLFGRILYQCSEFGECHPKRISLEMLAEIRDAFKAEMMTPDYVARIADDRDARRLAHKIEVERLTAQIRAEYPKAKAGKASLNLKAELKAKFPGVNFSVRSDRNSITVKYTDGPALADVESIAYKYKAGDFDGMDDSYSYDHSAYGEAFETVCGRAQYVSVYRHYSAEAMQTAVDIASMRYDGQPPTVHISSYDNHAYIEHDWQNEHRHNDIYNLLRASDLRF